MHSYPTDLGPVIIALGSTLVFLVSISRLLGWYQSRMPRLRLLTGTRPQRTALRLALAPVLREFLPVPDKTGQDVRAIVLVPTLSGSDGEPLLAEVEQASGSTAFIIRLAHRLGGTLRQPDEVAAALAEDLLYLYRHAAAVTLVRQTSPAAGLDVAAQNGTARKPVGRNGLVALPNAAEQKEAEETMTQFKESPHGRNNNQGS